MNDTQQTETHAPETLHEGLGLWDAISIIVGIVVGASIFHVPHLVFMSSPNAAMGLTVWVFGGLLALVGALCYAELATTYPRSGGDYEYQTRAFSPMVGFLFGWAQLILIMTASIGAMAYIFADYAANLFDTNRLGIAASTDTQAFFWAISAVVVLTALNVLGVTMGKTTQNILTGAKVLGLGVILIAGFIWGKGPAEWGPAPEVQTLGWGSLAIILVLYAYGGWNDAAFVAAEVRDRQRNIPLALIIGTCSITVIYLLVNAAYINGLGWDGVQDGLVPARMLEQTPLGQYGATAISILIMISALGAANGLIFTGARIYAAMGQDHRVFAFLGQWRPGRGAPVMSLLLQGLIALGLIVALGTEFGYNAINYGLKQFGFETTQEWRAGGAFDTLVSHTAPVFWLFFLMTGIALFMLRVRDAQRQRPFTVPLYPVLPIIFCTMCLYMLYESTKYVGVRVLFAVVLLAVGVPLYWLSRAITPAAK